MADKPGSVVDSHSSGIMSPLSSSDLPGNHVGHTLFPYLVLLRVGFTMPSNVATDAVRSYRTISTLPFSLKRTLGGIFSVALSVGSRPPAVSWHPALWSPDFPPYSIYRIARLPGQLRVRVYSIILVINQSFNNIYRFRTRSTIIPTATTSAPNPIMNPNIAKNVNKLDKREPSGKFLYGLLGK
ncbi:MAG: hypothetical protein BMS9Abin31_0042 [Gammaproteobacteria bacterium]|nr:MAG: hypothetical protein BMS9Abin31_0042 [Gammaproteobacteria bacterium]